MTSDKLHIGFIGLGIMGTPMAGHLARAGYPMTIHDINRARADALAAQFPEVIIADSPDVVGAGSDVVITMLPSGAYVREAALGDRGLIHGLKPGSLLLDTSSCEPWLTVETAAALAAREIAMVDAPVSGAEAGARAAELVFMAGGAPEALERVLPLLEVLGKRVFHLGPVGAGHAMKCINNTITAMTFLATSEGLVLGKKFGLDPDVMTDVLNHSTGMSWISQTHIKQRIISRKFDDPFKLELMMKDIGIAMHLAGDLDLSLPLCSRGQELWNRASQHAAKGSSVSQLVRWVEQATGVEITSG